MFLSTNFNVNSLDSFLEKAFSVDTAAHETTLALLTTFDSVKEGENGRKRRKEIEKKRKKKGKKEERKQGKRKKAEGMKERGNKPKRKSINREYIK